MLEHLSFLLSTLQKCEEEGPCRPVDELLDRPVERVLEYRTYLGDLLESGRKAGVNTDDLEVLYTLKEGLIYSHLIKEVKMVKDYSKPSRTSGIRKQPNKTSMHL